MSRWLNNCSLMASADSEGCVFPEESGSHGSKEQRRRSLPVGEDGNSTLGTWQRNAGGLCAKVKGPAKLGCGTVVINGPWIKKFRAWMLRRAKSQGSFCVRDVRTGCVRLQRDDVGARRNTFRVVMEILFTAFKHFYWCCLAKITSLRDKNVHVAASPRVSLPCTFTNAKTNISNICDII